MTPIEIRPCWKIMAPGQTPGAQGISLVVKPGAGWGSGTHETTQLCLHALALMAPDQGHAWRMLDFGSGSGILSIGAAKLGANVEAVEIDEAAIANSLENARLNQVEDRLRFSRTLTGVTGPFEIIVANILRPVLLEFAGELASRLAPGGALILSGLVGTDVPELKVRYASVLNGQQPEVYERGDWRALVWRRFS